LERLAPALVVARNRGVQPDVPSALEPDARAIGGGDGRYGERRKKKTRKVLTVPNMAPGAASGKGRSSGFVLP